MEVENRNVEDILKSKSNEPFKTKCKGQLKVTFLRSCSNRVLKKIIHGNLKELLTSKVKGHFETVILRTISNRISKDTFLQLFIKDMFKSKFQFFFR